MAGTWALFVITSIKTNRRIFINNQDLISTGYPKRSALILSLLACRLTIDNDICHSAKLYFFYLTSTSLRLRHVSIYSLYQHHRSRRATSKKGQYLNV